MNSSRLLCCLAFPLVSVVNAESFFDQVPVAQRKAFNSNRPTQADTAYTLDPGVLQLETAALIYSRDHFTPDGSSLESLTFGQTNIRLGVTENFELQTIVTPFVRAEHMDVAGLKTNDSGIGDVTLRGLWSLAGNDGKGLGVAFMPFIKLPSNTSDEGLFGNDEIEGGFEVPLAYALNDKTSLCSAPGVSFDWNGQDHDANPFATLTVFRTLPGNVIVFAELFGKKFTGYSDDSFVAQVDTGVVWNVTPNFSLDFAVYAGLTKAAPDLVLQTGFALRF